MSATYVYQLIDKELPFLGRFSYLFPVAGFLGFVALEIMVLQATGHLEQAQETQQKQEQKPAREQEPAQSKSSTPQKWAVEIRIAHR
ncbi:hypothetical protein AK812_SmicGene5891 [Symbiodinium microadriaticum]|uniref:Uncharacterized protein n=1 Tax=Symbiodinium microadriaticum TaxID=2951 RepID=A0A1Q9ESN5_SYMMI|nr:hypothetical protein AK812_SmicGene5891 [Symbiodinium microadriaticum]